MEALPHLYLYLYLYASAGDVHRALHKCRLNASSRGQAWGKQLSSTRACRMTLAGALRPPVQYLYLAVLRHCAWQHCTQPVDINEGANTRRRLGVA